MSESKEVRHRAPIIPGVLLVLRDPPPPPPPAPGQPPAVPANAAEGPEILLAVWDDGSITALNGHVDLGTGIRTALAQTDDPARIHKLLSDWQPCRPAV